MRGSTLVAVALLGAVLWAGPAAAERLTVCGFRFESPEELAVFARRLPPGEFAFLDLSPPPLLPASPTPASGPAPAAALDAGWLQGVCRPELRCDVLVLTAEFAGRFFGSSGRALSLQEMEEASCQARCDGLFHAPREVFLLACNTLATKDVDQRGPEAYLQVLLEHGFDRASAERVVAMRYGPLGPAFREALRRVFAGVPRLYGFASVAPKAEYTAPMLERYFDRAGDYRRHLDQATASQAPNRTLLDAFRTTTLVETTGLRPSEPASGDRDLICAVYDERLPVARRLEIVRDLVARPDLLAFVPSIQVFVDRHPPDRLRGDERRRFDEIRSDAAARDRVRALVDQLDVSALQLELAHFAVRMGWLAPDRFRALAVAGARELLRRPLDDEVMDVMCELQKRARVGDEFRSADLPDALFRDPVGIRVLSCLEPPGDAVTTRIAAALGAEDPVLRLWAAHALSRRLPLPEPVLSAVVAHLKDPAPEVDARLRWIVVAQQPLPRDVLRALEARDPALAAEARAGARGVRASRTPRVKHTPRARATLGGTR